jgi:tetratricopeptide (TPR) repeat protein
VLVFRLNLGFALAQAGRLSESAAAYREVLRVNPDSLKARADLGAVLLASSDLPGAIREYETIHARIPDNSEAAFKLGLLYAQVGRRDDAVRMFKIVSQHGTDEEKKQAHAALAQLGSQP